MQSMEFSSSIGTKYAITLILSLMVLSQEFGYLKVKLVDFITLSSLVLGFCPVSTSLFALVCNVYSSSQTTFGPLTKVLYPLPMVL